MNRENILAVADAIEKQSIPGLGFNMDALVDPSDGSDDRFGKGCGTVACIAGWAYCLQAGRTGGDGPVHVGILHPASHWLDLDWDLSLILFRSGGDILPSQAVSVLRHLAETGEVDWDRALAEPSK